LSGLSVSDINDMLVRAGPLGSRPVFVYGMDQAPEGAVPVSGVITEGHRCLAKALLKMALHREVPPVYLGRDVMRECCFGASAWLGFMKMPPMMKNLYASISKGDGNHDAHYLKATPESCQASLDRLGRIDPPGKYLVMSAIPGADYGLWPLSVLCFGGAEQIRNLCGLLHFSRQDPFSPVIAAWGAHCATFVTYPAGLAEGVPGDTAFVGPTATYGNDWFPSDLMAIGIPMGMAEKMCEDYGRSFMVRRPDKTYPVKRELL
jgi:hypothetical protein